MKISKKTVIVLICFLFLIVLFSAFTNKERRVITQKQRTDSKQNVAKSLPPDSVIAVVAAYVQARENSIGADQDTPDSWLSKVESITTASWFAQLHPNPNSSTGNTPASYNIAHEKGYIVQAKVSGCIWNLEGQKQRPDGGNIYCNLVDTTVDSSSGAVVPHSSLPYGWTDFGRQPPVSLKLVLLNGSWLVDGDESGQG